MADVRSLLRNERTQRRINHPQASYSATGSLECSVCRIPLKSDADVWDKHLKSTQHAMRQERLRLGTSQRPKPTTSPEKSEEAGTRGVSAGNKKRKADDGDDDDSRKRTRPVVDVPKGFLDETTKPNDATSQPVAEENDQPVDRAGAVTKPLQGFVRASGATSSLVLGEPPTNPAIQPPTAPIDEDEWAAFERDVATPPPDPSAPSALTAAATISAGPMTAAEIAAQSRVQASSQGRERSDMEVEGEKEDAARALEDEFDEMEGLEERVRRLREKREALESQRAKEVEEELEDDGRKEVENNNVEEDAESDDDEDDTGWGAWGR